ncbi:MAG: hypothetical protein JO267_00820 [Alphaproteobacteria bacterium]|nr:hypothetical protein [Alphaproteobacteria bacterium]
MRFGLSSAFALAALGLTGCIEADSLSERTAAGAVLGATLGAGIGATVAINPPLGATIGAAAGGVVGAATGVLTMEPRPVYGPVPARDTAAANEFYDTWPLFYHMPPVGAQTPPPPEKRG